MASVPVLSLRAVNRALLARQLLLERQVLPAGEPERTARVMQTIEHLIGLQAQAPFPPYYGLHSRLNGFRPEDLATLITDRSVVRIALMRGTIHLVSARDCLPLRRLLQPVIERGMRGAFGKQLAGVDPAELAAAGRRLVEAEPMTFARLGQALAARWPDHPPAALAQGVRTYVPLVQVPPRAEAWLGPMFGAANGAVSTATGVFMFPVIPYIQSLGLERDDLVQAQGISFTVSTFALNAANPVTPVRLTSKPDPSAYSTRMSGLLLIGVATLVTAIEFRPSLGSAPDRPAAPVTSIQLRPPSIVTKTCLASRA